MGSVSKKLVAAGLGLAALLVSGGCSVTRIAPAYEPKAAVARVDEETVKLTIGSFADRRGHEPNWLGEIRGKYVYPKKVLETRDPVSKVVRDMVLRGAKSRLMIADKVGELESYDINAEVYQLYGQITKLSANAQDREDAEVRVHLTTRLINVADNDEIYSATHRVDLNDLSIGGDPDRLGNFLEEAINQVVQESLDDPGLRRALVTGDAES